MTLDPDVEVESTRSYGLIVLGSGLVLLGVALGLWAASIFYTMLFQPGRVPLVNQVFESAKEGKEILELIKQPDGSIRIQGVGLRYVLFLMLAILLFSAISGIIRAFIEAGVRVIQAGSPRGLTQPDGVGNTPPRRT